MLGEGYHKALTYAAPPGSQQAPWLLNCLQAQGHQEALLRSPLPPTW